MTQLVLPNTIDPGSAIVASEHQTNYEAIRDVINGGLEGGSGSASNFKANGVTAREIADAIMLRGLPSRAVVQEGAYDPGDLKVTVGAGLNLNYASGVAWIQDDSGILAAGALIPILVTGASLAIAPNASGNPRIDQIILTITGYGTGTVSVLQGTATAAADLTNRNGAAALPNDAIRLADVLMPNGFAGPFVQNTHVRDRRPWARGAFVRIVRNADEAGTNDYTLSFVSTGHLTIDAANLRPRLETSGVFPIRLSLLGRLAHNNVDAFHGASPRVDSAFVDGSDNGNPAVGQHTGANVGREYRLNYHFTIAAPAAGSHLFEVAAYGPAGSSTTILARANIPLTLVIEELAQRSASNDGA